MLGTMPINTTKPQSGKMHVWRDKWRPPQTHNKPWRHCSQSKEDQGHHGGTDPKKCQGPKSLSRTDPLAHSDVALPSRLCNTIHAAVHQTPSQWTEREDNHWIGNDHSTCSWMHQTSQSAVCSCNSPNQIGISKFIIQAGIFQLPNEITPLPSEKP